jgi:ABC-type branched-subunit amino acid transport system substrate-binding protein
MGGTIGRGSRRVAGVTTTRAVALAVAVVLTAGALPGCSSRDSSDAGANGTTATTDAATAATTFGTLASPCGPGDASGATDVGVTDQTVTVAYGDDAGFPGLPGAGHEMSDAVKAMISWCNAQGGINGRTVVGRYYDAKITEVVNAVTAACQDGNFMFVGEGFVFDTAQEQVRQGCGLPAIPSYGTSPAFANGPLTYQAMPNPVDRMGVTLPRWYADTHPDKAAKVAVVYADLAASKDTADKEKSAWSKVGITFLPCAIPYNIAGEADWKPFVQRLKDCGAEAVSFIGTPNPSLENLLEASDQLGYHPDWLLDASFYDRSFADWNVNGWADDVYVQMGEVPFEHATEVKATQDYLDIVRGNGGDVSDLGLHSASAFLLWASAVQACGSDVTRTCVLDHIAGVHDWDGGGLSGPADVGANLPSECGVVLSLDGTTWVQVDPEQAGTLDCATRNVQPIEGDVVDRAHLGPDRRTG